MNSSKQITSTLRYSMSDEEVQSLKILSLVWSTLFFGGLLLYLYYLDPEMNTKELWIVYVLVGIPICLSLLDIRTYMRALKIKKKQVRLIMVKDKYIIAKSLSSYNVVIEDQGNQVICDVDKVVYEDIQVGVPAQMEKCLISDTVFNIQSQIQFISEEG